MKSFTHVNWEYIIPSMYMSSIMDKCPGQLMVYSPWGVLVLGKDFTLEALASTENEVLKPSDDI